MKSNAFKYGAIGFVIGAFVGMLLAGDALLIPGGLLGAAIGAALGYRIDLQADLLSRIGTIRTVLRNLVADENKATESKRLIEQWLQAKLKSDAPISRSAVDSVFSVVSAYVQRTPDLMEALVKSSKWSNLEQEVIHLLRKTSLPQFESEKGNARGVAGFLGDAYATQYLIEKVAMWEGGALARTIEGSTDLQAGNAFVASLLPPEIVGTLQGTVDAALKASQTRQMLAKMLQQSASLQGNWNRASQGIDFKKEIVRDEIRHNLAKDHIYL